MKRVQVTIDPGDSDLPLTYDAVTGADEEFARVAVVNWNVTESPATFLLRVRGDTSRFESVLERDDAISEYELLSLSAEKCYCFVRGTGSASARALWENFKRGSLMTIPPAEWNPDGTYTFTVVGSDGDVQTAVTNAQSTVADIPDDITVEIDSVGGTRVAPDTVVDRLSERQREAVESAIELGYYDTPREATSEDVARELGCATSTAAEHLRKAEAAVLTALFEE
ncbi:helix-turn-helix domain-containing protein [Natrialba swarupiae]|uniref:Bacterio-opsin activator n=1 Tax=Natrialba swarupiae TaxID=2448032 RepID=A0A5D5ANZ9_9EURY|nr:helix-turn-helix domain-containing protein [Natrialba swarupiae]TYT63548.1 bacterio-opsin activator [Natrialba swarupiae]